MPYVSVLPEIWDNFKQLTPDRPNARREVLRNNRKAKKGILKSKLKEYFRESKKNYPVRSDEWHTYRSELRLWQHLYPNAEHLFPAIEPPYLDIQKGSVVEGGTSAAVSWKGGRKLTIHRKKKKGAQQNGWAIRWGWVLAVVGLLTSLYLLR